MPMGGILAYSVPDGAQVLIDGKEEYSIFGVARTPAIIRDISASTHSITFRLLGYKDITMSIRVPQGGYANIAAIMIPAK